MRESGVTEASKSRGTATFCYCYKQGQTEQNQAFMPNFRS
jgi:hypothetical protein